MIIMSLNVPDKDEFLSLVETLAKKFNDDSFACDALYWGFLFISIHKGAELYKGTKSEA